MDRSMGLTFRLGLLVVVAAALSLGLAGGLAGCQAQASDALPRLLAVLPTSPLGDGTAYGVVHPNGWAYIVNQRGSIAVLDGPELVALLPWPGGQPPAWTHSEITIDPQTGYVWVGDDENHSVHVISGTEHIATIPNLGLGPNHLVVHPWTGLVYVSNPRGYEPEPRLGTVTVISDMQVITTVATGFAPWVLRVHPLDQKLYVGQKANWLLEEDYTGVQQMGLVAVFSGTERIGQTTLGDSPDTLSMIMDMTINDKTGEFYMTQDYYAVVYWDGKEDARRIPLGHPGYIPGLSLSLNSVAVDTNRNWGYVGSWDGPPSHVIAVHKDKIMAVIEVPGYDERGVIYDQTHDYIYVANRLSGSMSIIRGTEIITTLATGGFGPAYITVDEKRGYIYVSNTITHSIAVFGYEAETGEKPRWTDFLPFVRR